MDINIGIENMNFLEAISSETRVKIIEMLNEKPLNIKEIALKLQLSSAIVTKHIQKLESAGIVKSETSVGKRGMQKMCTLNIDQATLRFKTKSKPDNYYIHSIPIGQYSSFNIKPTCGIASDTKLIGMVDDPRYFADPEHIKASMLWFGCGWVEYRLPNYLLSNQLVKSIEISLEICSEAPGYNEDWPSDISFCINNTEIGTWTSPGDFGKNRGVFTPDWWNYGTNHGLMKTILINEEGSFIDGIKLSGISLAQLNIAYCSEITFRIANLDTAKNVGGISTFGRNFGNYGQDIRFVITY